MARFTTLLIFVLSACSALATEGTGTRFDESGSAVIVSDGESHPDLQQSAPGELRISPYNDSR